MYFTIRIQIDVHTNNFNVIKNIQQLTYFNCIKLTSLCVYNVRNFVFSIHFDCTHRSVSSENEFSTDVNDSKLSFQ